MTKTIRFLALLAALLPGVVVMASPPVTGVSCEWRTSTTGRINYLDVSWDAYPHMFDRRRVQGYQISMEGDDEDGKTLHVPEPTTSVSFRRYERTESGLKDVDPSVWHDVTVWAYAEGGNYERVYSGLSEIKECPPKTGGGGGGTPPADGFTHVVPWFPNGAKVWAVNPTNEAITVEWEVRPQRQGGAGWRGRSAEREGDLKLWPGLTVSSIGATRRTGNPNPAVLYIKGRGAVFYLHATANGQPVFLPIAPTTLLDATR